MNNDPLIYVLPPLPKLGDKISIKSSPNGWIVKVHEGWVLPRGQDHPTLSTSLANEWEEE